METAATTEDAPASNPTGCRRKRAIITYARTASKAYRSAAFASVHALIRTLGGAFSTAPSGCSGAVPSAGAGRVPARAAAAVSAPTPDPIVR